TQLRCAADAAARAAASSVSSSSTARSLAVQYAAANKADGSPIIIDPNTDVEFGRWNKTNHTFTVVTGSSLISANAVRVTCRRTTARGNPVHLLFASMIGQETCDAQASAIATLATSNYGIVGLDYVKMTGTTHDAYWSSSGNNAPVGAVASNGNITLVGGATIYGDASPGPGMTATGGTI